ncbi:MAG: arginine--tRNA ligase [Planctomycetota bacterium]|nr:MAG: arginine--tRNA ligase [Planctomycetota bacterium]REJ86696.1 MAG: arginine--tRNA ligase [Planctomycetota bacterium]
MNALALLRERFRPALAALAEDLAAPLQIESLLEMVKPSGEAKFGDYQANFAMPLGATLKQPPREVAARVVEMVDLADVCEPPEVAGPGFINLTLRTDWLIAQLAAAATDERLGIAPAADAKTYVIDYSAPNVAKPMHVGHIRSTVIGDALARTLRFLGHRVIGDNHIGDWGTQFGMIIYGYKNFLDPAAFESSAVTELARLYRLVNTLVDFHKLPGQITAAEENLARLEEQLATAAAEPESSDKKEAQKQAKARRRLESQRDESHAELTALTAKREAVSADEELAAQAAAHPDIGTRVLEETAALHAGDAENLKLWKEFLPPCLEDIERIYSRLDVTFDHTLGESFYHDRLAPVVDDLKTKGIAVESDGAMCVFNEGQDAPMIVQKQDGAFLYATTDLATIEYRAETWQPDAILYVVDHRQSLHFEQLFATVRRWGYDQVELVHVKFGTVLGEDGRPFKTRSGDTVGLDGLLDEAIERAYRVVAENDDAKPDGAEWSEADRRRIAEVVGIAALKYADLSQNRESDYVFSYDKMLAMNGNTATYMQYAYARVRNIFARGSVDVEQLRDDGGALVVAEAAERALALELLRFSEALEETVADYRPNHLTGYLFELANRYSTFYNECPVLKAADEATRRSRLLLCDLTARTLQTGLSLLGINTVEKM